MQEEQADEHKAAVPAPEPEAERKPQEQARIWVLADDRPGNVSQALGVAQALHVPYLVKKISYDGLAALPNLVRGASLLGLEPLAKEEIVPPWPELVIAAGRRTAPVARYIRKQSGGKTKLVQCMWPGRPVDDFNLVVVPAHDAPMKSPNLVQTLGAPNGITSDRLERERFRWEREFAYLPTPRVAVLIGGGSKHMEFTEGDMVELARKLNLLMQDSGGGLMITTSRRTSEEMVDVLKREIKPHFYLYDLKSQGDNPYLGFLAHADAVVVTGDSVGMCSEACSTGKPVYIFNPGGKAVGKIRLFQQQLFEYGCARPLQGDLELWRYEPLDEAKKVAATIKDKLLI